MASAPSFGSWHSTVRMGSLSIGLSTRDPLLAEAARERCAGFTKSGPADCTVELVRLPCERGAGSPYLTAASLESGELRLSSSVLDGLVDLSLQRGRLSIHPHARFGAGVYLENALRQIAQVLSVSRGAFFLHAAAVAPPSGGEVLVFPGRSGSGKTTLSTFLRRSGGRVLSDDMVLVEALGARPRVAPTPFFGSLKEAGREPGASLPIARILFLEKASDASLHPAGRSPVALARLLANIPFTECFDRPHREKLMEAATRLAEAIPLERLRFRRDSSFFPLIGWGDARSRAEGCAAGRLPV